MAGLIASTIFWWTFFLILTSQANLDLPCTQHFLSSTELVLDRAQWDLVFKPRTFRRYHINKNLEYTL